MIKGESFQRNCTCGAASVGVTRSDVCCFQKHIKEEIQLSLILELSNEGYTVHGEF